MAEYIDKSALYEKIAQLEELARNRYLETPSSNPCCSRYMTQLNERTVFKHIIADFPASDVVPVQEWIPVDERLPENFISVLGYMTDAGEFPPVRECYTVGNVFFFPSLGDVHPVSHWCEMPQPPKGE